MIKIETRAAWIAAAIMMIATMSASAQTQSDNFTKNFKSFKNSAIGVDFYAGSKSDVTPFEKVVTEARQRLSVFLGNDLARGAVVICSTLAQKDSVSEAKLLRQGYRWVLIELTPEASAQQILARIRAESGGEVPAAALQRFQNPSPEMKAAGDARLVSSVVQRLAYATIMTTLAPDKPFRASRVDDMARSPLPDWMDIGLASYAVGGPGFNLRLLKDRIEEAFPLEDVLTMSRPFVAPATAGGSGGQAVFVQAAPGGGGSGGARVDMPLPPPGGQVSGGQASPGGGAGRQRSGGMNLSKDVQDRMMFDAEASSFFSYLVAKAGIEKTRRIVSLSLENKNSLDVLSQTDVLDKDLEKVEQDWQAWLKEQKADGPPGNMRITSGPERPPAPQ
jgi:hypothetical protein